VASNIMSGTRHTQGAVVARVFARRTCTIEVDLTDTTDIIIRYIPSPGCHGIPFANLDFHLANLLPGPPPRLSETRILVPLECQSELSEWCRVRTARGISTARLDPQLTWLRLGKPYLGELCTVAVVLHTRALCVTKHLRLHNQIPTVSIYNSVRSILQNLIRNLLRLAPFSIITFLLKPIYD